MFLFDDSPAILKNKPLKVELPPKGMSHDQQEQDPIVAGHGRCRSCDCTGYKPNNKGEGRYCVCGHHYDQHR